MSSAAEDRTNETKVFFYKQPQKQDSVIYHKPQNRFHYNPDCYRQLRAQKIVVQNYGQLTPARKSLSDLFCTIA